MTATPTVSDLRPGDGIPIYGGRRVRVLSVCPVTSEPEPPYVRLTYQWASDPSGRPMTGIWVLPANRRLPLSA